MGAHLTLVEERSLTGIRFPKSYVSFVLSRKDLASIEAELRAQIERVPVAGLRVTHLNGHQHLHMLPSIVRIVLRLAGEYEIEYVRRVRDRGGRGGIVRRASLGVLNLVGSLAPAASERPSNDSTIGVMEAGHLTANRLIFLLRYVEGVAELVTHPGMSVDAYPHWHYDWDPETDALCDPRVRDEMVEQWIDLLKPSDVGR